MAPIVPPNSTADRIPRPKGGWTEVESGCLKARIGGGEGALGLNKEANEISNILLDGCSGAGK